MTAPTHNDILQQISSGQWNNANASIRYRQMLAAEETARALGAAVEILRGLSVPVQVVSPDLSPEQLEAFLKKGAVATLYPPGAGEEVVFKDNTFLVMPNEGAPAANPQDDALKRVEENLELDGKSGAEDL